MRRKELQRRLDRIGVSYGAKDTYDDLHEALVLAEREDQEAFENLMDFGKVTEPKILHTNDTST